MARRQARIAKATLTITLLAHLAVGSSHLGQDWQSRRVLKRANTVVDPAALAEQSFDYVIVGGGTAGLVMAGRLSEDANVRVAVIEAGLSGDAVPNSILPPAQAFYAGKSRGGMSERRALTVFTRTGLANMNSEYDWHYNTEPQTETAGRTHYWPRGKVLGGSSAVNGNYMVRASKIEHDSWAKVAGSSKWTWDAIYPFMKKSETWTAPSDANVALAQMVNTPGLHGESGPIQYSYPSFFFPQLSTWISTFAALGVGSQDPAGGENFGAFIATSAINPETLTRSYSRTGYLDPAAERPNLVVLTGFQATKVLFSGTAATGVSFAATRDGTSYTVNAKEVILAGGVIGTPQLLQVSGVGDAALLASLSIPVVVDLPGVGMFLQDHLSGSLAFEASEAVEFTGDAIATDPAYAADQLALWTARDPTSLYTAPNNAVAYINLTTLFGAGDAATFITDLKAARSDAVSAYSANAVVQAGYAATYAAEVDDVYPTNVGQAEILMANTGSYGGYPRVSKTISIQAAIQHPLSRGSIRINSTSTFDAPVIDPGYLKHPLDIQVLRQAFKFARTVSQTEPLASLLVTELSPGAAVQTDEEWETWIRSTVHTEYHPAGTTSMLPQNIGGVVDEEARIHGTTGLRVVDASIVPVGLSAHMVAPLYGIAENVFNILSNTVATPNATGTTTGTSTKTKTSSAATGTGTKASSAGRAVAGSGAFAACLTVLFALAA